MSSTADMAAPHGRCPVCDGPLARLGYHASEWADCPRAELENPYFVRGDGSDG